ncbi:hypothetical protein PAMA_002559 [Pampus argenteus]
MKKHSARVAPLSACNSPVLTLTKVEACEDVGSCAARSRAAERARESVGGGLYRERGFLSLSCPGSVKCESRQSGRARLARLGFAAISGRDLHCRDCRGREESGVGMRLDGKQGSVDCDGKKNPGKLAS